MLYLFRGRILGYASALALSLFTVVASSRSSAASPRASIARSLRDPIFADAAAAVRFADDSLRGRSGKLLVRFVSPTAHSIATDAFARIFGPTADAAPGVYPLSDSSLARPFSFIALHPFSSKQGATLGNYRIGYWPGERRRVSPTYANPVGFIEVTEQNANMRVSEHFRLRDFLTHDQERVWPKYLVLRADLIDKLELVIAELEAEGHPVRRLTVMSGFRTPQYNANGGNTAGRAQMSRHMYGDASDVFVDNDGDGTMDDVNGDGRVDYRDAQVIVAAAARVERAHHDLLGGGGVYKATRQHGPFAHIDVRGKGARWGVMQ
jgi:hypothetical protein